MKKLGIKKKPINKKKSAPKKRKRIVPKKRKGGNKTGRGGFQKGKSGNPSGRPKDTPEVRAVKEAYREDLFKAVSWATKITRELTRKEKKILGMGGGKFSLLEIGVVKAYYLFSLTGNAEHVKYITDQTIGKPKETLDIDSNGGNITYIVNPDYIPNISNGDKSDNKS